MILIITALLLCLPGIAASGPVVTLLPYRPGSALEVPAEQGVSLNNFLSQP